MIHYRHPETGEEAFVACTRHNRQAYAEWDKLAEGRSVRRCLVHGDPVDAARRARLNGMNRAELVDEILRLVDERIAAAEAKSRAPSERETE